MNALRDGLHPSFDALSAWVDLTDVDAARSRTGRHVARCAACAATVAGIRALGDAARAVELPGAPAGLWERIERARDVARVAPAGEHATKVTLTPAVQPRSGLATAGGHAPWKARRVVIGLAVAASVAGVLLMPSPFVGHLDASTSAGRWRFSPANPMPGTTVRVRYEPPATMPAQERMLLLGEYLSGTGRSLRGMDYRMPLVDSLAVLRRESDGAYAGDLTLPATFTAVALKGAPADGGYFPTAYDGEKVAYPQGMVREGPATLLVAGGRDGRPSFRSLSDALLGLDLWGVRSASAYSVADTLRHYYPGEPLGYAANGQVGGRRLLDDLIAWFTRGERDYARFDRRLAAEGAVSADHEIAMALLAGHIQEPGEQRRWTMRLAQEHPDDPRALRTYSMMLDAMLSRPGTVDSARHDLLLADSLYEANGHHGDVAEMEDVAYRLRDTAEYAHWQLRGLRAGDGVNSFRLDPDLLGDPAMRQAALGPLHATAGASCELPTGRYPAHVTAAYWKLLCVAGRSAAYGDLSVLWRLAGEPVRALADADSALAILEPATKCWVTLPHQRRGEALLALGDTAHALPELAYGATGGNWEARSYQQSLAWRLRPAVDSATWIGMVARAHEDVQRCMAENRARR